jgi:hypothetical protein
MTVTHSATPLILPGLFTAAESEVARPVDRVYFTFGFFDHFRVGPTGGATTITGVNPSPGTYPIGAVGTPGPNTGATTVRVVTSPLSSTDAADLNLNHGTAVIVVPKVGTVLASKAASGNTGFDLSRYEVGFEKTFFDGAGSVYVRVPGLDATDNTSNVPIDGFGDVSVGFKYAFLRDCDSGSTLTGGLTVSLPTARDTVITTVIVQNATLVYPSRDASPFQAIYKGFPNPVLTGGTTTVETTRINPTYLQPWVAGLLVRDKLFAQEYFGAIVPTDLRIPVYLNENLIAGYELYHCNDEGAKLSSVAPFAGAQALIPASGSSFHFPDQLFLSAGLGVKLGKKFLISGSYVTPVVGPRAFDWGATMSVNYLF